MRRADSAGSCCGQSEQHGQGTKATYMHHVHGNRSVAQTASWVSVVSGRQLLSHTHTAPTPNACTCLSSSASRHARRIAAENARTCMVYRAGTGRIAVAPTRFRAAGVPPPQRKRSCSGPVNTRLDASHARLRFLPFFCSLCPFLKFFVLSFFLCAGAKKWGSRRRTA